MSLTQESIKRKGIKKTSKRRAHRAQLQQKSEDIATGGALEKMMKKESQTWHAVTGISSGIS